MYIIHTKPSLWSVIVVRADNDVRTRFTIVGYKLDYATHPVPTPLPLPLIQGSGQPLPAPILYRHCPLVKRGRDTDHRPRTYEASSDRMCLHNNSIVVGIAFRYREGLCNREK